MKVQIHQSLIRKQLFLGANKLAVYTLSVVCSIPLFAGSLVRFYTLSGFLSILCCIGAWFLGLTLLKFIAKYDTDFFSVMFRYLKYQKYYPPITHRNYKNNKAKTKDFM